MSNKSSINMDESHADCPVRLGGNAWVPYRQSRIVTKSVNGGFDIPIEVVGGVHRKSGSTVEKSLKRLFTRGAFDDELFESTPIIPDTATVDLQSDDNDSIDLQPSDTIIADLQSDDTTIANHQSDDNDNVDIQPDDTIIADLRSGGKDNVDNQSDDNSDVNIMLEVEEPIDVDSILDFAI